MKRQRTCKPLIGATAEPLADRRFINETELAELTGVAIGTWQKKRLFKRGPRYYKIGGSVRYRLDEVLAWIASNARGGEAA